MSRRIAYERSACMAQPTGLESGTVFGRLRGLSGLGGLPPCSGTRRRRLIHAIHQRNPMHPGPLSTSRTTVAALVLTRLAVCGDKPAPAAASTPAASTPAASTPTATAPLQYTKATAASAASLIDTVTAKAAGFSVGPMPELLAKVKANTELCKSVGAESVPFLPAGTPRTTRLRPSRVRWTHLRSGRCSGYRRAITAYAVMAVDHRVCGDFAITKNNDPRPTMPATTVKPTR